MEKHNTQAAKARQFSELHHGEMLVLPNIWDPLGALLLQQAGFPAVATQVLQSLSAAAVMTGKNCHSARCSLC